MRSSSEKLGRKAQATYESSSSSTVTVASDQQIKQEKKAKEKKLNTKLGYN